MNTLKAVWHVHKAQRTTARQNTFTLLARRHFEVVCVQWNMCVQFTAAPGASSVTTRSTPLPVRRLSPAAHMRQVQKSQPLVIVVCQCGSAKILGPYVTSGDKYLIQRIPFILGITVNYWNAGSGNSPIRTTQPVQPFSTLPPFSCLCLFCCGGIL